MDIDELMDSNKLRNYEENEFYFLYISLINTVFIIRDHYIAFSISALVSARDSHIKPDSEDGRSIWVEDWYQGRYVKFHVIFYLSHILNWLLSGIDFYIAERNFELKNSENKPLRELPLFNLQIFLFRVLYNDGRKCL